MSANWGKAILHPEITPAIYMGLLCRQLSIINATSNIEQIQTYVVKKTLRALCRNVWLKLSHRTSDGSSASLTWSLWVYLNSDELLPHKADKTRCVYVFVRDIKFSLPSHKSVLMYLLAALLRFQRSQISRWLHMSFVTRYKSLYWRWAVYQQVLEY